MSQIDHINLIHKELSNEISTDERILLKEWKVLSEENMATFETISLIWNNSAIDDQQLEALCPAVDLEEEFSFLETKLDEEIHEKETKIVPIRRFNWGIAAGLAVLVGLASFWVIFNFSGPKMVEFSTGDQAKEIVLADGSVIHLNANSSLKYPEKFEGATRTVEFKGEAFFSIAKDANHPFVITTPYEEVKVLGTSFNIRAYEFEPNSEIAVTTGKVQVNSGVGKVVLLPNEKVVVDHSSGVLGVEETESLNETAWLTKVIHFSDTPVKEALEDLEKCYAISFSYDENLIGDCPITTSFDNEILDSVLVTISTVLNVEIERNTNGEYILVGGGCQ